MTTKERAKLLRALMPNRNELRAMDVAGREIGISFYVFNNDHWDNRNEYVHINANGTVDGPIIANGSEAKKRAILAFLDKKLIDILERQLNRLKALATEYDS